MPDRWLLLTHAAATVFMVGLIWFVQVVHYPLYDRVGRADFPRYERDHQFLVTLVVGPVMLIEVLTAVMLLIPRDGLPVGWLPWIGAGLLLVVWISTAALQVPRHEELGRGFDENSYRFLVVSNWVRTVAWSARGGIALTLVAGRMS